MSNQNSNNNNSVNSRMSPIEGSNTISNQDTLRSLSDKIDLLVEKIDQFSVTQETLVKAFNEMVCSLQKSTSAIIESASAMKDSATALRESANAMKDSSDALKVLVENMRRLGDYIMGVGGRSNQINRRKLN